MKYTIPQIGLKPPRRLSGLPAERVTATQRLLWTGEVGLAVADLVFAGDFDFDLAVGVCGAAGIGVVAETVLGAQLAIDAVEDAVELAGDIGVEHCAAHGVRYGLQGVLAGGVAAAFVFYGTNDNGVEKRAGANRRFSGGV